MPKKKSLTSPLFWRQLKISKPTIRAASATHNIPSATLTRYMRKINEANLDFSAVGDDVLLDFLGSISTPGAKPVSDFEIIIFFIQPINSFLFQIFSVGQEKELMTYVLRASDIYYGLSIEELRTLAYQYARVIKTKYPGSWDTNQKASKDWYYSFMNRHKNLSLRTPEQISQNRAKSFNKENVDAFFDNLHRVMNTPGEPHRIWNMDECGFPTVPTKTVKTVS